MPLFEGLSGRQARIFALMSDIEEKPAGTRLCAEDEPGNDMFVVIDGELAASLAREGGRVELARMHRGETVGEIAMFSGVRSADVDVVYRRARAALRRRRSRTPRPPLPAHRTRRSPARNSAW